jgi:hypothetical protein
VAENIPEEARLELDKFYVALEGELKTALDYPDRHFERASSILAKAINGATPIIEKREREKIIHKIIAAYHEQTKWHKASRRIPEWLAVALKERGK